VIASIAQKRDTDRFAWLMMPLPLNTGTTDVEAVLKEMMRPSVVKGEVLTG
jgi:hypothetical protein